MLLDQENIAWDFVKCMHCVEQECTSLESKPQGLKERVCTLQAQEDTQQKRFHAQERPPLEKYIGYTTVKAKEILSFLFLKKQL